MGSHSRKICIPVQGIQRDPDGPEPVQSRFRRSTEGAGIAGSRGGIVSVVDAAQHHIRLQAKVDGEFHAAGRRGIQIGPVAGTQLRQFLITDLPESERNGHGHAGLVELGGDDSDTAELAHDFCQNTDTFGLISIIICD